MELLNGRKLRDELLVQLKQQVEALSFTPVFCDVLVGENKVSAQYVRMKEHVAESLGIEVLQAQFSESITTDDLVREIESISKTKNLCGLIVQLPLPAHIDTEKVVNTIPSAIDVDVLGKENRDLFYKGSAPFIFPTAGAILTLLESLPFSYKEKSIVVIGEGELVGRPVTQLLKLEGAVVTSVDINTQDREKKIQEADIIISAAGSPKFLIGEMVKKDVVVIDAGTSEDGGVVVGDGDYDSLQEKVSYLAPVPGGVGPLTTALLMHNVIQAAYRYDG